MEKYEAYDLILDLILKNRNTTTNNIKHYLPDFPEKNEARINLMLEDMFDLAPRSFNKKPMHGNRGILLIATPYTDLLKEDGGFEPLLRARQAGQVKQPIVFQQADGSNPLADLHPTVQKVSGPLFRDGHFKSAILEAYIALNAAVRDKSGFAADGVKLMQNVFSKESPRLLVSNDPDEQQGFMWLFTGAMMGIRNPKAHKTIEQNDPQRTLEWLSFASVLFKILDESQLPE